jgi:hypothetical protein
VEEVVWKLREFDGRIKQRQQFTPLWWRMSVRGHL